MPGIGNAEEREGEWYYRPWAIALAILCFGPLGLFPLWYRPRTSVYFKAVISGVVIAATVFMFVGSVDTVKKISGYYSEYRDFFNEQKAQSTDRR